MAIGVINYPNIEPVDGTNPNGNIKDKVGAVPGTPINKLTNGDIQVNLAGELLRSQGIIPNGLPDDSVQGFEILDALRTLRFHDLYVQLPDLASLNLLQILAANAYLYNPINITSEIDLAASITEQVVTFGTAAPQGVIFNIRVVNGSVDFILNSTLTNGAPQLVKAGVVAVNSVLVYTIGETFTAIRYDNEWEIRT